MNIASRDAVRIPKISGIVASAIRKRILRGELSPGDTLPQEQLLADEFGVARATVREAIRILEAEDLLRISRGSRRGAIVLQPSTDAFARTMGIALQTRGATIGDIFRARVQIEPIAARLAAETNPVETGRLLEEQVLVEARVIALRSDVAAGQFFGKFHGLLMSATGNITLSLLGVAMEGLISRHLELIFRRGSPRHETWWKLMEVSVQSRRKLARLIGEGDGAAASAHWSLHMENVARHWLRFDSDTALVDILD